MDLRHKPVQVFIRTPLGSGFSGIQQADLRFGPLEHNPVPPKQYLDWLTELRVLNRNSARDEPRIEQLQRNCVEMFASTFGLGYLESRYDKTAKLTWNTGVDYGSCLPNWGAVVNAAHKSWIDFPGTDHEHRFSQNLPLLNGQLAQYRSAVVSMPYKDATLDMDQIMSLAGSIGWTCSVQEEWSWHAPDQTTLLLFKRTTPHDTTLQAWQKSFKRWMVENRARLMKSAGDTRRKLISDIVECKHLPLDLVDFEECRERYLKEYVFDLYEEERSGMALIFRRLMEQWARERLI